MYIRSAARAWLAVPKLDAAKCVCALATAHLVASWATVLGLPEIKLHRVAPQAIDFGPEFLLRPSWSGLYNACIARRLPIAVTATGAMEMYMGATRQARDLLS